MFAGLEELESVDGMSAVAFPLKFNVDTLSLNG